MSPKLAATLLVTAASLASAQAACGDLLPPTAESKIKPRPVTAEDLATLRDIGQPGDRVDLPSPLGLSPDGRHLAFILRRADPPTNSYCQGLVLIDLASDTHAPKPPRLLDTGGDLIRERYKLFGHALPESGVPRIITPIWSPDGRHIAWLKRTGEAAQIWLARIDGKDPKALTTDTTNPAGVEQFIWSADGQAIVFGSRTGELAAKAQIAEEAKTGHLLDERFRPLTGRTPFPREAGITTSHFAIDTTTARIRPATDTETKGLDRIPPTLPKTTLAAATGPEDRLAWTMPGSGFLDRRLTARVAGKDHGCDLCGGEIVDFWWSDAGTLFFLKRQGKARQALALHRWSPGKGAPRTLTTTEDLLIGCRPAAQDDAICLTEASLSPRRIVKIDGSTGKTSPLWNPNPGFDRLEKPVLKRHYWTNENGIETFGDIVLPKGNQKAPYPLVIVQYGSRGFLRGGTGDEYPILALAAHGHAVLSFQRPLHLAVLPPTDPHANIADANLTTAGAKETGSRATDAKDATTSDTGEHAERRSVQSSLERGIALALRTYPIDPDRIGITGLSDGATTLAWALIDGGRFAAAAMSSCCLDPGLVPLLGEAQIDAVAKGGLPRPGEPSNGFWSPVALSINAGRITTPILMNLADDEFLGALSSYWALRQAGKPVEMHVFPDEHHIKYQPAHRLAIYERNLAWFDFWLKDKEDPAPALSAQYRRWRAMKVQAGPSAEQPGTQIGVISVAGPKPQMRNDR
ncbi:Atxe2 family lasso peptide isopeptidase [Sphingomonas colocasiae]|uniref:Atxe2 family lasso peptide isopeptidase n=1 Tax=Sphingomonas colocasiae TaxID=1848973 RepID=A0ABS7PPX5_9SPHN|nr:Atxe2 family lasso peptide isopeptidase [Sphingomonas colocasiae]MBY8823318.1 Atxe2 family lasso peptide isopeptidase [Sphingomonas colocasiae]MBY8826453.1 Atxe2 family lasso peptide isopeptidase [Sphingomonas colocasiae]